MFLKIKNQDGDVEDLTLKECFSILINMLGWFIFALLILSFSIYYCLPFLSITVTAYQSLLVALLLFSIKGVLFTYSPKTLSIKLVLYMLIAWLGSFIL